MKTLIAALALLAALSAASAQADTIACPDLSTAVRVGNCPSEAELRYTFNGYCSDNARIYSKDGGECNDYQSYRLLKNVVLWESADGAFQGYVSCDQPAATTKAAQATTIAIARQGNVTRLACTYGDGSVFTQRTKAACRTAGDGNCGADPAACKASCD